MHFPQFQLISRDWVQHLTGITNTCNTANIQKSLTTHPKWVHTFPWPRITFCVPIAIHNYPIRMGVYSFRDKLTKGDRNKKKQQQTWTGQADRHRADSYWWDHELSVCRFRTAIYVRGIETWEPLIQSYNFGVGLKVVITHKAVSCWTMVVRTRLFNKGYTSPQVRNRC